MTSAGDPLFTPSQWLALLPLILAGATAVLVMLTIAWRRHHHGTAAVTIAGLNLTLLAALFAAAEGAQVVTPLLRVDGYASFYMALILVATLACATLAHAYLEGYLANREEFYLLLVLAATGGLVLACADHLAALFIGLELLSVPLYGMVAYTFRESRSLEASLKYLILSAVASTLLLFGMALIYAQVGSMGLAEVTAAEPGPLLVGGVGLLLAALAFKLSLVPFHLWTPDVYQGAPAPVGAFLATASKVAVFALVARFFDGIPAGEGVALRELLGAIAVLSILVGNLLALTQNSIKRLLGYSSIAHFGYLLVPLVAGTAVAREAVAVYLLTYVITVLGAFGVVALMSSPYKGDDADALFHYRGLFWKRPILTAVMTVAMLSLAGIPLTAGFIGKFYIFVAGAEGELWWLLGAVVLGSAIALYYYLRVMVTLYLHQPGMRRHDAELAWGQRVGGIMVLLLSGLTILLGVLPQPALDLIGLAELVR